MNEDRDLLVERKCTDIRGVSYGCASIVYGYQRETKKRLYIIRSGEMTAKFFLPAAATKGTRRDALFQRQTDLMRANPDGALDLVCALKAAQSARHLWSKIEHVDDCLKNRHIRH